MHKKCGALRLSEWRFRKDPRPNKTAPHPYCDCAERTIVQYK